MARKLMVTVVDDLDGESVAAETLSLGIDSVMYEIDLCAENARELRAALSKWTPFARRIGRTRRRAQDTGGDRAPAPIVRAWARRNGFDVPSRGRIPTKVREAYHRTVSG